MRYDRFRTNLTGKVAVITGAGGVLCSVFARALARVGASVALLDLNQEAAQTVADEIIQQGGTARAYRCDVLDRNDCLKVAERVRTELGCCDILLNGAGGNHPSATTDEEYCSTYDYDEAKRNFFNLGEEGVSFVFNPNMLGTLLPTQVFARQMLGRTGCSILNISSMNAYTPLTKIPAYSAAKAAVTNFTQWLAVYFSKVGIRVNAIAPGFFATHQNAELLFRTDGSPTPRTEKILAATPMGRLGDAEKELAGAVLFLLNEEAASFITGICLPIDGGFSAYSGV